MAKTGSYPYGEPNIKSNPTAEDWAETQADINAAFVGSGKIPPTAQSVTKSINPASVAGVGVGAGAGLLLPAITGGTSVSTLLSGLPALGGIGAGLAGVAGAAYGIYEALGGGEGEGLFGLDILGGGDVSGVGQGAYIDGIPLSGPGLAEPPGAWIEKEWTVQAGGTKLQYYLVRMPQGGKRIAMYNFRTKAWKSWRVRTSSNVAYIGKKLPSHRMLTRLRRNLGKHSADARTILKITSPTSLAVSRNRRRR